MSDHIIQTFEEIEIRRRKWLGGEPWTWIISISWVFDHCLAMQWEISETLSATREGSNEYFSAL